MKKILRIRRKKPVVEEIEPRILYSADFSPGVLDPHAVLPHAEQRVLDASGEFAVSAAQTQVSAPQSVRHEVVFVDTAVPDYQKLVQDITANSDAQHQYDVVLLKSGVDGIKQITQTLAGMHDVSAVHIISHGADGVVQLGGATLNFDSLLKNASQIKGWGQALTPDADLLIYGCDVAENADGKALVDALSRLTGADVAASEDLTGAADKMGDWTLEYATGQINTALAVTTAEQAQWDHALATFTVSNTNDSGPGSLRAAITSANGSAGNVIQFTTAGTINLTSALPTITNRVTIDATTAPGWAAGKPVVELNGASAGAGASGLVLGAGSSGSTIRGLVIDRFAASGIRILGSSNNTIAGNFLGTNTAGTAALGNQVGVFINTSSTNNTIGGTTSVDRNLISGNTVDGVQIIGAGTQGNVVKGNYIGLDVTGTVDLGNTNQGVAIFGGASNNTIGGTTAGAGNVISGNGNVGVQIDDAAETGNAISGNSIYGNGSLGIDLNKDGVTANDAGDADTGANNLQNYPVLTSAVTTGAQITVAGTLNSTANSWFRIEFFASVTADASGHGEAERYLGFVNVTTPGSGNIAINATLAATVAVGEAITATATAATDNTFVTFRDTSEFSLNVLASNTAPVLNASRTPVLTAINEDAGAPSGAVGTLVSSLVDFASPAGQVDNVTDADSGALLGIAITAADTANGTWFYSTNGGTTWNALGAVANNNARLLAADANTRIYFQPNADFNGTVASGITFRAWDQTSGSNGTFANTTTNGGTTAFSSVTDTAAITVNAVNDAPVLNAGRTPVLTAINEDAGAPSGAVGTLVSSLVDFASPAGQVDNVTDADSGALLGIAITAADTANGTWFYSTNGGTTWNALGAVANNNARLLAADANTRIYFQPNADFNGTVASGITFRAWDQTSGSNGTFANTTTNGGTTAFSSVTDTAAITVNAVNDAPVLNAGRTPVLTAINEDAGAPSGAVGTLVSSLVDFASPAGQVDNVTDADSGALLGIAITAADTANGTWFYSTNGGTTWNALGAVANNNARLLAADANTRIYFQPNADFNGTVASGITFRAWDQTSGSNGTFANTTTNGGTTAFSSVTDTAAITVNAVNDAPVLNAGRTPVLTAINEDAGAPSGAVGTLVSSLVDFASPAGQVDNVTDADSGALLGIAITAADTANGTWFYSTNGGTTWNALGAVANNNARLLAADANTRIYFQPNADFNGTVASGITFRAWDQTSGSNGTFANTTTNGGTTAFSSVTDTAAITVNAVNDAPVLSGASNLTAINEDPAINNGTLVSALIAGQTTDADAGALTGIAVTAVDNTNGTWQYSTNGGGTWNAFGAPSNTTARLLTANGSTLVRFVPNANWNGTVSGGITFRAWDQTSGVAGSTADTSANGGTTAFSTAIASASITVNPVNDAPVNTVPAPQGTSQNTALVLSSGNGNQISIADVDAGASLVQVTLTASNGVLTLNGIVGLGFTTGNGVADATMTFTGAVTDVNTALNGLTFAPTAGYSGAASISITTNDQGNTGGGGPQSANSTVNITVNPSAAPNATNDAYALNEDNALNVPWWNTAWTRREQITFTGNTFGGAQSLANFPVLVTLNSSNIDYSRTQNAGQDLRFFDANGAPLAYEIEEWNETGNSYVWVKVPQIDTTGTDSITMYYGNASAPAGQNPTAVWTQNFTGVYHLSDSSTSIDDSSANSFDGTAQNGATAASGFIGGGRSFDGVDQYVDLGNNLTFVPTTSAVTLSTWIDLNTVSGNPAVIATSIYNGGASSSDSRASIELNGTEIHLIGRSDDSGGDMNTVDTTGNVLAGTVGQWHYVTGVIDYSTDTMRIYLDGVQQAVTGTVAFANAATPNTPDASTALGAQDDGSSGNFLDGSLDEVRFASTARSAAWIRADYLSMTNAFLTVGAAQVAPGTGGVLQNDTSPGGNSLSAVLVGGPSNAASFVLNADGTFTYTPMANFAGTDTFTYRANDGFSNSNVATVTLTVNPINDAPVGSSNSVSVLEDGAHAFSAADFGFSDPNDSPANTLTAVKITTLSGAGSLTDNLVAVTAGQFVSLADITSGKLVFTPVANASGAGYASFTFQVQDNGGVASGGVDLDATPRTMTINVTPVNDAPVLSGASNLTAINEDPAINNGTLVSALIAGQTTDADAGALTGIAVTAVDNTNGTWQYSTNGGGTWNAFGAPSNTTARLLTANGSTLVRFVPNANWSGTVSGGITFRAWDQTSGVAGSTADTSANGGTTAFSTAIASASITVNPVNDAPVLSGANNLTAIDEDPAVNPGTLVSALIAGQMTDADTGAVSGIAVTAADNTNGTWQYSTDGGATWSPFGAPSNASARLLAADAGTYVRLVPNADYNGSSSITFRGWDQTSGTVGSTGDATVNGGSTAFSAATAAVSININSVNDAPQGASNTVSTLESTAYIFATADFGFGDPNDIPADALLQVEILDLPGAGLLTHNGIAVTAGEDIAAADIVSGQLVFTPAAGANGAAYANFTFRVQDTGGTANGGVDLDPTPRTMTIDVTSVNDAPVLSGANNLTAIDEDPAVNAGTLVSALIAGQMTDADTGAVSGIAVTAADNTNGTWQYSTDGGTTWSPFGAPSNASARLLAADAGTSVRFVPNANYNGSSSITFRAWDQSAGVAAGTADTTTNGGSSAFSTATASASITVNSVNDAPAGADRTVTTLEDSAYTFGAVDFGFSDPNDSPANVLAGVAITTLPGAGSLTDNGVAVAAGQFVSVADISGGLLRFTPAASANGAAYATFTFQVQDNGGIANGGVNTDPTPRAMTIDVTAVNDAPVLGNDTLTIVRGGSVILSGANLSASDVDNPAASLAFTVSNVVDGQFELVATPGVAVTNFTQGAISAGQVRFVHDGSTNPPAFDLSVDDGTLNAGPTAATIVFTVPATGGGGPIIAPPVPTPPTPGSNSGGTPPASPPSPSPQAKPAQPVVAQIVTLSGGLPVAPEPVGTELFEPIRGANPFLKVDARPLKSNLNPAPLLKPAEQMLLIQGTDPQYLEFGPLTKVDWSAQTAFPNADRNPSEHDQIQVIMESVRMGGIALSVGVVWWASRVTGLIGSLLASMPAWRQLDPLPIIGRDEEEDRWDETEDSEADADELAISMVLEGPRGRDAVGAQ